MYRFKSIKENEKEDWIKIEQTLKTKNCLMIGFYIWFYHILCSVLKN